MPSEVSFTVDDSSGGVRESCCILPNRLECFFAAHHLEAVDIRLKGSPHEQLATMVRDADADVLEVCAVTGFVSRIIASGFPHARVPALGISPGIIAQGRLRAQACPTLNPSTVTRRRCPTPTVPSTWSWRPSG